MKTIFKLVALVSGIGSLLISNASSQQETPRFGFVRIVNAINQGQGNAKFSVDGEDIFPKGYQLGETSGGMSLKQGSHSISVSKEGLEKGTTKLDLVTNETTTLIAFAEQQPAPKEGDPPVWAIKLLRLKQREVEKGYGLTLVSVAKEPETKLQLAIQGKGAVEKCSVTRLGITYVNLGESRGEVFVKIADKIVTTVSPDTPGNYVVVVYDAGDGKTAAIYFFDPKFVIAG